MQIIRSLAVAAVLTTTVTVAAHAQRFGAQVNWGSDSDIGVGGRIEASLANKLTQQGPFARAFFMGSFDVYFTDCAAGVSCSYFEINPGMGITLPASTMTPYLGAGLNIARASASVAGISASNTETGINLIGGLKFPMTGFSAFTEARASLGGADQLALSFGILFGGGK